MLLSSLPVETPELAQRLIDWYCARWEIELYFRILKQACRVEALRLLAQLGGFLARKGDGEPGVQTTWRGYMRLLQSIQALQIQADVEAGRCVQK
jgi:hypothetical protein